MDRPVWRIATVGPRAGSREVQGEIRFAALRQTTGRGGIQRDGRVFPLFAAAVAAVEPDLAARIARFNQDQEAQADTRLSRAIREAFRKALSEIEALSTAGLRVKIADPAGPQETGTPFDGEAAAASEPAGGRGARRSVWTWPARPAGARRSGRSGRPLEPSTSLAKKTAAFLRISRSSLRTQLSRLSRRHSSRAAS